MPESQTGGSIGETTILIPPDVVRRKGIQLTTRVRELALCAVISRLAPRWIANSPPRYLNLKLEGRDIIRYLAANPEIRLAAGGPEVVDQYTLNFLQDEEDSQVN